jgi:hypothetical protein
MGEVR